MKRARGGPWGTSHRRRLAVASTSNPPSAAASAGARGFVSVSEKGTEAAAATVVVICDGGEGSELGPIVVDRPFIWLVREEPTGTILFGGIVAVPRG